MRDDLRDNAVTEDRTSWDRLGLKTGLPSASARTGEHRHLLSNRLETQPDSKTGRLGMAYSCGLQGGCSVSDSFRPPGWSPFRPGLIRPAAVLVDAQSALKAVHRDCFTPKEVMSICGPSRTPGQMIGKL